MTKFFDFSMESSTTIPMLSSEMLMEEIKQAISTKFELANRDLSIIIAFLELLDDQEYYKSIKTNGFKAKSTSACVKISIETPMDELKAVVAVKCEFDYRGKSKNIVHFRFFRYPNCDWSFENHKFFNGVLWYK